MDNADLPTERMFSGMPAPATVDDSFDDLHASIRAMIVDARDFNETDLAPARVLADRYFQGLEPFLEEEDRSTIVMTEVRDTIMGIMPSLMRIFTSQEHVVSYVANTEADVPIARQATEYVRNVFMEENPGYLLLHSVFMDALKKKTGVIMWSTHTDSRIEYKRFEGIQEDQVRYFAANNPNAELQSVEWADQAAGTFNAEFKVTTSTPKIKVDAVPPEEFRINRSAKNESDAYLIGRERMVSASDLIQWGYDPEVVNAHRSGASDSTVFAEERILRNPAVDSGSYSDAYDDMIQFGEYFIKIDTDGDGIAELCRVCVIGDADEIIHIEHASYPKLAMFCVDPEPHTAIGHSVAELVIDLQRIKTNIMRATLDSLAQTIYPRPVVNETITNMDDVLNTGIGAPIRTKGPVTEAVFFAPSNFNADQSFNVINYLDNTRQMRTGVSEASKGVDPRALQSTTVKGVDMLITGAQERIELSARTLAETGMKTLFKGLLQEISDNPAPDSVIQVTGKFIPVTPSAYDASMKVRVNPSLGKGSDADRLMMLTQVKATQETIITTMGADNPLVTPMEYRNTLEDILNIANIRDTSRYFAPITPQIIQQHMQAKAQQAAQQPNPAVIMAQAEQEKIHSSVVQAIARTNFEMTKHRDDNEFRHLKLQADIAKMVSEEMGKYGILPNVDMAKHFVTTAKDVHIAHLSASQGEGGAGGGASASSANEGSNANAT